MHGVIIRRVPESLGKNVFRLLQRGLDLLVVEDKVGRLLAVLVAHARVTAGLAHHLDHLQAELGVLVVGVADGDVEGGVLVQPGDGVAFKVLDVEEGVHCVD